MPCRRSKACGEVVEEEKAAEIRALKLRTIAISLYGHPNDVAVPFGFQTRALCNFVQRYARTLAIETRGFNQIVIHDDPSGPAEPRPRVVPEKSLSVPFRFEPTRYGVTTPGDEKQRYFIEVLRRGLEDADVFAPAQLAALHERIDAFAAGGFLNRWTHASKSFRHRGITVSLECELTLHEFQLTLEVHGKSIPPTSRVVLTTKPDEICFHHKFKDVRLDGDDIVITSRLAASAELARFHLSEFSATKS
jgi:hypothetical protein